MFYQTLFLDVEMLLVKTEDLFTDDIKVTRFRSTK